MAEMVCGVIMRFSYFISKLNEELLQMAVGKEAGRKLANKQTKILSFTNVSSKKKLKSVFHISHFVHIVAEGILK